MKKTFVFIFFAAVLSSCSLIETESAEPFLRIENGTLLGQDKLFEITPDKEIKAFNTISSSELMAILDDNGWESNELYKLNYSGDDEVVHFSEKGPWDASSTIPDRFIQNSDNTTYFYWAQKAYVNHTLKYDENDNSIDCRFGPLLSHTGTKVVYADKNTLVFVAPYFAFDVSAYIEVFKRAKKVDIKRWPEICCQDLSSLSIIDPE